jgi:hypothetical protein
MLDIVAPFLARAGIAHARLDGSMDMDERAQAVARFTDEPDCRVFMLSLKAGGVGLHLVAATHVWLLDGWWNPMARASVHACAARACVHVPVLLADALSRSCSMLRWSSRRSSGATGWGRRSR